MVEEFLKPTLDGGGQASSDDVEKTLGLVTELKEKFQSFERTLMESPEAEALRADRERKRSLERVSIAREKLERANRQIEGLTGKRKLEQVNYNYVPERRVDKNVFSEQLRQMRIKASKTMGAFKDNIAAARAGGNFRYNSRGGMTPEAALKEEEAKMQAYDLQYKNEELAYLQSIGPIDLAAFHGKLHPLLDERLQALMELRQLQLEGNELGDI